MKENYINSGERSKEIAERSCLFMVGRQPCPESYIDQLVYGFIMALNKLLCEHQQADSKTYMERQKIEQPTQFIKEKIKLQNDSKTIAIKIV